MRCLEQLGASGLGTISSRELADAAGVKPTQLRKDLTSFGHFGTRGLGYDIVTLLDKLGGVLGRAHRNPVVLVGVGNLGAALLAYGGFRREAFEVVAGFDVDVKRQRRRTFTQPIYHLDKLETYVRQQQVKMAIITVPPQAAQDVTNRLIGAGVNAILNFAPTVLHVPANVVVSNVNLAIELENLSYFRSLAES